MPKKIIIDTDPGVDDAMAILLAFNSPELEVVALTTVFGNVTTQLGTQNALRLVEFAGHPAVPVANGADRPLAVPLAGIADFVHGQDGLGNVYLPAPLGQPDPRPAPQLIIDLVMQYPGEITLVAVGPLTNLAIALMLEPRIVHSVAQVVVMGGAATVNGNVTPAAEANIWHDPHAADMVFTAGWPISMVGLDVTEKTFMSQEYLAALRGNRTGDFIWQISRFYQAFHTQTHKGMLGIHTHDPSAIAYLIDPTLFTVTRGPVRVLTEGIGLGMTLLDRRGEWYEANQWSRYAPVNVCVDVESERLLALYKARIQAAP